MDEQTIASILGNSGFNPGMSRGFMRRRPMLSNIGGNPINTMRRTMPDVMSIIQQNPQALTSLLGNSGGIVGGGGGNINLPPGLPQLPPGMPQLPPGLPQLPPGLPPGFRPPGTFTPSPVKPPIARGRV